MKIKGSITIFISLTILIIVVLVCTIIESARISISQTQSKAITYMALDSVYAGYGRQLYEDYGILLAWEQHPIQEEMQRYMQDNTYKADLKESQSDLLGLSIEKIDVVKQKYATDNGGEVFVKQVKDCGKYLFAQSVLDNFLTKYTRFEDSKSTDEDGESKEINTDKADEIINIVKTINDKTSEVSDTTKLKGKLSAVYQKFNYLEQEIKKENNSEDTHNKAVRKFINKYKKLLNRLNVEHEHIDELLDLIKQYEEMKNEFYLKNNMNLEDHDDYIVENKSKLENIEHILDFILKMGIEESKDINSNNIAAVKDAMEKVSKVEKEIWGLNRKNNIEASSKELSLYESAKKLVNTGVLALVVEDINDVSDNSIQNLNLPSSMKNTGKKDLISEVSSKVVFTKYIEFYFNNYCQNGKDANSNSQMKYEMEYVIGGKMNDKENLTNAIEKIIAIRNVANMAYLVTDSSKMTEISSLSDTIALSLGILFLTPVIKAVLLEAWALTEAIIDVKSLMNGEKIQLIKTKEQWKSQIENIGVPQDKDNVNNAKGLDYTEYLEIIIMGQNSTDIVFRTMDIIQVNIQNRYNTDFLMSKCFGESDLKVYMSMRPIFTAIPIVTNLLNIEQNAYDFSIDAKYAY